MSEKKKTDSPLERLGNGLFKENPTFVLALGMCPTLAVTTSAMNGLGMGLSTTAVLMMSNLMISLLRKVIPSRVRIPAFIVIIATFVTVVQFLMQAYLPGVNSALGIYIPLIVVNCIILGRAEAYAYMNPPIPSFFDGLGMGLGFSLALTCIGAVRELLGAGKVFDHQVMPGSYVPINIFILAPGAFFVLAALTALQNYIRIRQKKAGKEPKKPAGCVEDCQNCAESGCGMRFYDAEGKKDAIKKTNKKAMAEAVSETPKKAPAEAVSETPKKAPAKAASETPKKAPAENGIKENAPAANEVKEKEDSEKKAEEENKKGGEGK